MPWSANMSDYADELELEDPDEEPEIVHWMTPRPLSVGALGLSGAVAGAFVLGAATAVGVLALMHWLKPTGNFPFRRGDD
jgi:hypothetical protein